MSTKLKGLRIMIVEDDYYQAQDSRDFLELEGAQVIAIGATAPDISTLLDRGPIDAALIDINLGQGMSFDFARSLRDNAIPFVFLTGYDASMLPEDLAVYPCISKPADYNRIVHELALLAKSRTG